MKSAQVTISIGISMLAALAFFALMAAPARAQAPQTDLRATIRAELLSDPRTSGLSSAELNAMVDILAQQAQKQGITSHDIMWRPWSPETFTGSDAGSASSDQCGGVPRLSCIFDQALGFIGEDTTIPFILGAASMGLTWILAEMIHRRRYPAV